MPASGSQLKKVFGTVQATAAHGRKIMETGRRKGRWTAKV